MKNARLFFGAVAFLFAFASAFAFKAKPALENPAYINADGQCQQVEASCNGDAAACEVDLGPGIGQKAIHEFQEGTTCGIQLEMP